MKAWHNLFGEFAETTNVQVVSRAHWCSKDVRQGRTNVGRRASTRFSEDTVLRELQRAPRDTRKIMQEQPCAVYSVQQFTGREPDKQLAYSESAFVISTKRSSVVNARRKSSASPSRGRPEKATERRGYSREPFR